jgi:protein disulfide-isomerase A6
LTEFLRGKIGVGPRRKVEEPSRVEMLTDKSFQEKIGAEQDVLVAFTAPWCGRKLHNPQVYFPLLMIFS